MQHDLRGFFSSVSELIEYLFIIGLHKEAFELAEVSNTEDLAQKMNETYLIKHADLLEKINKTLIKPLEKKEFCLLSQQEYEFLYWSASTLSPNSKILEIGTYLGGSTVALCDGSSNNSCEVTTIDVYHGFNQKNGNFNLQQAVNWDYNYWQNNTREYANRIRSIRGSATNTLRRLARDGERFDLIFLDTAHDVETYFELSLISCIASSNCILIADDVVDWNSNIMTSAWALSLKNFLCHPRFFEKFAIANFKDDAIPFNFKFEVNEVSIATLKRCVADVIKTRDMESLVFK